MLMADRFLEIQNLTKTFGGLTAIDNLSLAIERKTIVGLIGPNGAGKTTLLNLITGTFRGEGTILFNGERIDKMSTHEICYKGIGRTFQIPRVFGAMTCLENVMVPGLRKYKDRNELAKKANELTEFFLLDRLRDELAANLSGGQKKLLEMARVLMLNPALVLLDEPFHGVHPELKNKICENIIALNKEQGMSFLIISHDLPEVMKMSRRVIVLSAGKLIADGPPEEIRRNEKVIDAYIGV